VAIRPSDLILIGVHLPRADPPCFDARGPLCPPSRGPGRWVAAAASAAVCNGGVQRPADKALPESSSGLPSRSLQVVWRRTTSCRPAVSQSWVLLENGQHAWRRYAVQPGGHSTPWDHLARAKRRQVSASRLSRQAQALPWITRGPARLRPTRRGPKLPGHCADISTP